MTVSLFVFLVLCLSGIKLAVEAVLFIAVGWPSWSERALIMSDVEDEFNLVLSTKILSVAVLELF
jgi:hypothetical protein